MINYELERLSKKKIILLQGPVGNFFYKLSNDLRDAGATVYKINFNAGDCFFYPKNAIKYIGTMEEWEFWFQDLTRKLNIDVVFLFGDCRPIHRIAIKVAKRLNLDVGVFEEGYIRPNYITLERFGANNNSQLPKNPSYYLDYQHRKKNTNEIEIGRTYWNMVWFGFLYFTIGALGRKSFPCYRHHRPLTITEALPWIRSAFRKYWYQLMERGIQSKLTHQYKNKYFLVPLQVYNDTQITEHSDFDNIEEFIKQTLISFSKKSYIEDILVFKHHPMDRGYKDYSDLIKNLSIKFQCKDRTIYIHDQHLPTLINNAKGVVVVNSTVGISALQHSVMVKVCGRAIYDLQGLTYQGLLDNFWKASSAAKPDPSLYSAFKTCVIDRTQLNGSFYKPLLKANTVGGVIWFESSEINSGKKTQEECRLSSYPSLDDIF